MNQHRDISKISVAVLAGGKSRRLNQDKVYLRYRGQRLVDRAVELAAEISPQIIVISNQTIAGLSPGVVQTGDIFPGKGPLAGIHAALAQARTDYVAIMPVDMPFLTAGVYRQLLSRVPAQKPVVAKSSKGIEPLVSIWPSALIREIEKSLRAGRLGVHVYLEKIQAHIVDFSENEFNTDERVFININTADDLRNLL